MNQGKEDYCIVCLQEVIKGYYRMISPIDDYWPQTQEALADSQFVEIGIRIISPNLAVKGFLDGEESRVVRRDSVTFALPLQRLSAGTNNASFAVVDTTSDVFYDPKGLMSRTLNFQLEVRRVTKIIPGQQDKSYGDFNHDGVVDLNDFFLFADAFDTQRGDKNYSLLYDLDLNGKIFFEDFFLFVDAWGWKAEKKASKP